MLRQYLWVLGGAAILGGAATLACRASAAEKPNILLLFVDDLNYEGFGFTGGRHGPTPQVDEIARAGVVFQHGYVSASTCCPSRAGLLTGRYQQRFGHETNAGQATPDEGLPVTEKTIADRLRPLGYRTGIFGKWHLGHGIRFRHFHPQSRGFDESFAFMGSMVHYERSDALWEGFEPVRERRYLTDAIAERTADFVRRHRGRPWFAYAAFNFIHTPLETDPDDLQACAHIADETLRIKHAMTRGFDRGVGKMLRALQATEQEDNTLIFLTNDNGDYTGNGRFKGGKGRATEGGNRVPFVVQWKRRITPSVNDTDLVSTLDILPTAVAAAGGRIDPAWGLDGQDLLPVLRRDPGAQGHDVLFWRMFESKAVRRGPWKLLHDGGSGFGRPPLPPDQVRWCLYHVIDDPGEERDVSASHPELAAELLAAYRRWDEQMIAPRWKFKPSGEMGQWSDP